MYYVFLNLLPKGRNLNMWGKWLMLVQFVTIFHSHLLFFFFLRSVCFPWLINYGANFVLFDRTNRREHKRLYPLKICLTIICAIFRIIQHYNSLWRFIYIWTIFHWSFTELTSKILHMQTQLMSLVERKIKAHDCMNCYRFSLYHVKQVLIIRDWEIVFICVLLNFLIEQELNHFKIWHVANRIR